MSEISQLRKEFNQYASVALHFILQPNYRTLNKAQPSYEALVELAREINQLKKQPEDIHDSRIDKTFQKQKTAVLEPLRQDYSDKENSIAFKEAEQHLMNAYSLIKTLRQETPVTPVKGSPAKR